MFLFRHTVFYRSNVMPFSAPFSGSAPLPCNGFIPYCGPHKSTKGFLFFASFVCASCKCHGITCAFPYFSDVHQESFIAHCRPMGANRGLVAEMCCTAFSPPAHYYGLCGQSFFAKRIHFSNGKASWMGG